jgi:hypothetical protein
VLLVLPDQLDLLDLKDLLVLPRHKVELEQLDHKVQLAQQVLLVQVPQVLLVQPVLLDQQVQ